MAFAMLEKRLLLISICGKCPICNFEDLFHAFTCLYIRSVVIMESFIRCLCSRHGLVDRFHSISHGELVHDLLRRLLIVHFPGVIAFGIGDLHHATVLLFCGVVEDVLQRKTGRELRQDYS